MDERQSDMSLSRQSTPLNFLDLNDDVFDEIFSYLSFDELAKIRLVCSRFNNIAKSLLNKGATAVKLYNTNCQKEINAKLPRRESERKAHPLSQQLTLLTSTKGMLTHLLSMYHNQVIVVPGSTCNNTCFIPGKFLDECYRVIRVVMATKQNKLFHSLTEELSDIYHMALNHFQEHILPAIKRKQQLALQTFRQRISSEISSLSSSHLPKVPSKLQPEDRRLIDNLRKENSELKSKVLAQEKLVNEHERKLLLLEQHLGLSLSQKVTSPTDSNPAVASTSGTTLQPSKRSLQDDEEPRPTKRLQSE